MAALLLLWLRGHLAVYIDQCRVISDTDRKVAQAVILVGLNASFSSSPSSWTHCGPALRCDIFVTRSCLYNHPFTYRSP